MVVDDIVLGFGEEVGRILWRGGGERGEVFGKDGFLGCRVGVVVVEVRVDRDRIVVGRLMGFLSFGRSSGRDIDEGRRRGRVDSASGNPKAIMSWEVCSRFSGGLSFLLLRGKVSLISSLFPFFKIQEKYHQRHNACTQTIAIYFV